MTINSITFKSFDKEHKYINFFVDLKDDTYVFTLRWNDYSECAFLSITDYENNPIISGLALVNNLKIRNVNLPYDFYFVQINGETYEPTLDNLASEFAIVYDDGE